MQNHGTEEALGEHMDREQAMAAGSEPLISMWLDSLLYEGLAFSEDDRDEEREFKIAAAREALRQLVPEGANLAERMQAVQYLCAFQAGQLALAEANSPYLPPEQRTAARRFARQAMALTSRQLGLLTRLGRERGLDQQAARFQAGSDEAGRQHGDLPPYQALAGETAQTAQTAQTTWDGERPAENTAAPGPAAPVSRQQRRAQERQERKALRRLKGAA